MILAIVHCTPFVVLRSARGTCCRWRCRPCTPPPPRRWWSWP
ncbi:hypothetical protein 2209_scaffold64_00074 [Bacteriophage sp.]|nr:hypothetical protein 2209_scaffold64_00074 [Bacteriophage sp.]